MAKAKEIIYYTVGYCLAFGYHSVYMLNIWSSQWGVGVVAVVCCCSVAKCVRLIVIQGLQNFRFTCPSLSSRVCSSSCPLCQWCHPTISSSVAPFFSGPQSFPASVSFPMSQLFISGGQSIRTSVSASVLPVSIQGLFSRIDWFDLLAV